MGEGRGGSGRRLERAYIFCYSLSVVSAGGDTDQDLNRHGGKYSTDRMLGDRRTRQREWLCNPRVVDKGMVHIYWSTIAYPCDRSLLVR